MTNFTTKLNEFLNRYRPHTPGFDCAVHLHGQEIFRRREGYADLEQRLPLTENHLYHIYSNTKVITCTAALQLMEQGFYRLDDPLSAYYPEFAELQVKNDDGTLSPADTPITVRDVFRMTAGIGDGNEETTAAFFRETNGLCPTVELPRFLARVPLCCPPGARFHYSIGHELLAGLICLFTGETFGGYLKKHIFAPLGMTHTGFEADPVPGTPAVQYAYCGPDSTPTREGSELKLIPPILRESASGGLRSTVEDYMTFQDALCAGELLLKRETIALMAQNHLTPGQSVTYGLTEQGIGYGLGVRAVPDPANPKGLGSFGWGGAAGTYGSIHPEKGYTVFFAQQLFSAPPLDEIDRILMETLP